NSHVRNLLAVISVGAVLFFWFFIVLFCCVMSRLPPVLTPLLLSAESKVYKRTKIPFSCRWLPAAGKRHFLIMVCPLN
ncbi:hypothetical protein, partial [Helicobacter pylori]|uniref:hypothetical protein n=1 Tax=Helicobacter pylori TaxID=210 RepID=UPI0036F1E02B